MSFFGGCPFASLRVGPLRSSQVCSALHRLRLFGLPPSAALLQPLSQVAALLCGGLAALSKKYP